MIPNRLKNELNAQLPQVAVNNPIEIEDGQAGLCEIKADWGVPAMKQRDQ